MSQLAPIRSGNFEISEEGFCVFDGERVITRIPRQEVRSTELLYGCGSAHPLLQALVALFTITLGVIFGLLPIYHLLVTFLVAALTMTFECLCLHPR
jgi:hypothetical protein